MVERNFVDVQFAFYYENWTLFLYYFILFVCVCVCVCVCVVSSSYSYLSLVFLCSLKALTRTPSSKLRLGHKLYEVLDKTKKKWLWHGMWSQGSALRKIEGSLVAWTCKFEGAHNNNLNKKSDCSCPRAKVGCQRPSTYNRAFFFSKFS